MTSVPEGWYETTLGELGRYLNGRGFKKSEWRTSGLPIIRIQNLTGSNSQFNYFQGEPEERYTARRGDLLISWAATLGAYIWDGPEAVVNQHIFKVESFIDARFHKYLLDYKLSELMRGAHGSGMVHVTRGVFDSLPVVIPRSRTEQERIVEFLDDQFSRLDAAEAGVRTAARRLQQLDERTIVYALTGGSVPGERLDAELTDVGTQDGKLAPLPVGWAWKRLGDLADVVGGVTKDSGRQTDPNFVEVPYLRVANVQRRRLDLAEIKTIRVPQDKADGLKLQAGDVLMNEGGDRDKLARGWIWNDEVPDCIHQNHVFRARIKDEQLSPELLAWATNTLGGRWADRNGKQSVNLASISLSVIRKMPIPVPPLPDQPAVLEHVERQLAASEYIAAELTVQQARSKNLRRSLLSAALEGRLAWNQSEALEPKELAHV